MGGTSDSHHILSCACKQSCYSNSVIKCCEIQWDENRKQWPSTLNSSSVIHVCSSLTSPPSAAWACQACVLVFCYPSVLREGRGLLVRVGDVEKVQRGGWRDFSCPRQKESVPGPPLSHTSSPSPAFLTQLPAVMDDDMCHIKSTCIHRGSASSMLACFWLNRRSELRGRYVALEALLPHTRRGVGWIWSCQAGKVTPSREGLGSTVHQAGSNKPELNEFKIMNGSQFTMTSM